jgi:hypothetical protein
VYRRIVLAVDPEGLAESVLPIVAALARRGGGEVFVIGAAKAGDPPEQRAALEQHVREASGPGQCGVGASGQSPAPRSRPTFAVLQPVPGGPKRALTAGVAYGHA